jgi:hypothetical protein
MSFSFSVKVNRAILRALVLTLLMSGLGQMAQAKSLQQAVAVDYLQGEGDVQGLKLAYQRHVGWLSRLSPSLDMLFEASANFWRYGPANSSDSNAVLAVSPILRYPLGQAFDLQWDLEFGIGVSLLDDTRFAGKDVSTHYQFEDRLGLVSWLAPDRSLTLRYLHYSNAGFKRPNPGLDFVSLSYAWHF